MLSSASDGTTMNAVVPRPTSPSCNRTAIRCRRSGSSDREVRDAEHLTDDDFGSTVTVALAGQALRRASIRDKQDKVLCRLHPGNRDVVIGVRHVLHIDGEVGRAVEDVQIAGQLNAVLPSGSATAAPRTLPGRRLPGGSRPFGSGVGCSASGPGKRRRNGRGIVSVRQSKGDGACRRIRLRDQRIGLAQRRQREVQHIDAAALGGRAGTA